MYVNVKAVLICVHETGMAEKRILKVTKSPSGRRYVVRPLKIKMTMKKNYVFSLRNDGQQKYFVQNLRYFVRYSFICTYKHEQPFPLMLKALKLS